MAALVIYRQSFLVQLSKAVVSSWLHLQWKDFSWGQGRGPCQDMNLLGTGTSTVVIALPVLNASVSFLSFKLQLCATDNKTFFHNNFMLLDCLASKWKNKQTKNPTHLCIADGANTCLLICLQNYLCLWVSPSFQWPLRVQQTIQVWYILGTCQAQWAAG